MIGMSTLLEISTSVRDIERLMRGSPPLRARRMPIALTYLSRPATIAGIPFLNVSSRQPRTYATGFAIPPALRVAPARLEEDPPGKGARHLRCRCGAHADRHHRSPVGVRCRVAGPYSVQGRGPHANLVVLVRQDPAPGGQPPLHPSDRECRGRRRRAGAAGRPVHGGKEAAGAADRSGGARLSHRIGVQGLQAPWLGMRYPAARRERADRLPEPLFTPASKAPAGQHDENIDFDAMVKAVGRDHAAGIQRIALDLYRFAAEHARQRGILIADTKFEFGLDVKGRLVLIDEALTPDSSRFWPMASYKPGISPPSFDKQFVRDYLESLDWNKKPPAPHLPPDILTRTSDNYREALRLLTAAHP